MKDRIELLMTMQDIVYENTEHYKSDFIYDINYMFKTNDKKFIWIVRKYGTNIARLWPEKNEFTSENYSSFIRISKSTLSSLYEEHKKTTIKHKFFIVDLENNAIKRIYGKTIEKLID